MWYDNMTMLYIVQYVPTLLLFEPVNDSIMLTQSKDHIFYTLIMECTQDKQSL